MVGAVRQPVGAATTAGDFAFTADPAHPLTVALDTLLDPTTVGNDVPGPMADFDPTKPYSWLAVQWSGTFTGPIDPATLDVATVFDRSGFINPINGTFGWQPDTADRTLSLTYTPTGVPEPATLALTGLAALSWWVHRRRRFSELSV